MLLKFIKDAYVDGVHVYQKGQEIEISDEKGSASRWIRRAIAIPIEKVETFVEEKKVSFPQKKKFRG